MTIYTYPNDGSVIVVVTTPQENGDTLLRYEVGYYSERYLRKPDNTRKPRWFLMLVDTLMPVAELDVPKEVRMSWVYCYERAMLPLDLDPFYAG